MREYVKPMMDSEVFVANEYFSACYKINCNVPGTGYLYAETMGNLVYKKQVVMRMNF